jgi:hypothetical protein
VAQKKSISSPFHRLRAPLSYEKTNAELRASARADVEKLMEGFKKAPPPNKSVKLEVECKMLRSLVEPKKPLSSDYKLTMQSLHCAKRSDEILQNEDKQILKFYKEAGLSIEQLHGQSDI